MLPEQQIITNILQICIGGRLPILPALQLVGSLDKSGNSLSVLMLVASSSEELCMGLCDSVEVEIVERFMLDI
jgi:hypothetical protein